MEKEGVLGGASTLMQVPHESGAVFVPALSMMSLDSFFSRMFCIEFLV